MERSMSAHEKKVRKNFLAKTWSRCRSLSRGGRGAASPPDGLARSPKARSWPRQRVAPEGCFSVYVGPEREKFAVRMECVNHPLFRALLDQAETEYGYATPGPLELPCEVDCFERVLWEMEQQEEEEETTGRRGRPGGCSFALASAGYHLLSSPSWPAINVHR